ncbi:hypothetical protein E4T44_07622 [Aureobasidium sp. EXF-8845]|nr:hypothetical protein E4T44_07622 [Aureobasidium sp. EXF-8845]KAI4845709.1 hypothetical protein E4T45_07584 [Aureobasidium sp. EXF-8846]
MIGDSAKDTMEKGASAGLRNDDFGSTGVPEHATKPVDTGASALSADGSIGKQFTGAIADGSIGQIGEKVGGPFSSKGAIGKQFTTEGSIGGALQQLGKSDDNSSKR